MTGVGTRVILTMVMALDKARSSASQVAGNLIILRAHYDRVHRIVDEEGDWSSRSVFETQNRDGPVGDAILVVTQPPALARRKLTTVGVDISSTGTDPES